MRALVTGAAGFIGSHLCDYLILQGHEVTGLDNLSTGDKGNLAQLQGNPAFELVFGSVLDPGVCRHLMCNADVVYHLAAAVGTFTIRDHWLRSLHSNAEGTRNVVENAAYSGLPLLFTSSSEVYGVTAGVLREDSPRTLGPPQRPRWSYAEAKALDESLVAACVHEMDLRAVVARLFNVAGPRQSSDFGMVIPRFVRQALAGQPITVFGDGMRTRCFCHVADVVPVLAQLPFSPAAVTGEVLNVGSAEQVTIRQLAERVCHLAGSDSEITHRAPENFMGPEWDDLPRGVPDCSAVERVTGFRPTRSLDEIITDVIEEARHGAPHT